MTDNGKQPAFPTDIETPFGASCDGTTLITHTNGLTKREYFAGLAMQGLVTNSAAQISIDAELAVTAADALLAELAKTEKP